MAGEAPGAGDRVSVEQAADLDAVCGDGLDPQDVTVGQAPARFAGLDVVVVLAADDQVTGGGLRALGYLHRPAAVDQAEMDQVAADPPGQFPAACPVRGRQQHVMASEITG